MNEQHPTLSPLLQHGGHEPVLLDETIKYLDPKTGENFIDGTVGDGGHAGEILKLTGPDGRLIGFDRDEKALRRAQNNLSKFGERITLIHDNFKNIDSYVSADFKTSGVLFDFGFSLVQIKEAERGFSFREQGPLDMRYNRQQELTAADIVNKYTREELETILKKYGEERYARKIADEIVRYRKKTPIATTLELVSVIGRAVPKSYQHSRIHFATRTFQALRIETNRELESIEEALPKAVDLLVPGGRMATIAFHSLEDRIVKHYFRALLKEGKIKILTKKPIKPADKETEKNPRARSAKLRAVEKI
jgi:16S rRNA (cytosine1402-N4)-methyltransferase